MPDLYVRLAMGDPLPDLPERDVLDEGLYWVRMVDMGFRLVSPDGWRSRPA
jgi:carbamoyl-phosphate synthase large subunit